jgi:NitT/TauT family transport system substrate-binding protein
LRLVALATFCLLFAAACNSSSPSTSPPDAKSQAGAPELIKVKLGLNWYPEAEHGGFYAALVNGYYRDAGLDVEIVKGGPSAPVMQQVAGGQMEFGIYNADGLLLARAEEAPVVALMAPIQISPRCIMVHKSSGIKNFDELKNMTIAMSNSQPFYRFLRKKVSLEGVTVVPYQGSVAQFLTDENFAQQAYVFSEPFTAEQQGGDPESLMVSDLGFNPYTSVLFASEDYLKDHADIAGKLVKASIRGWEDYLAQPAGAHEKIHALNPEMSLEALDYGVKALAPLVRDKVAEQKGIGCMSLDRWQTLLDQMVEIELIAAGAVKASETFTAEFLTSDATSQSEAKSEADAQ